ncbi:hypothetical protein QP888_09170 [Corynebacterium sp. MSK297]|nr:hypothetical protein [Corynebacterium sp. MSK297]MDK8846653.1 hypothetical protein [Corynebacterium sp. MSK297]
MSSSPQAVPQAGELNNAGDFAVWNVEEIGLGMIHLVSAGNGLNL